MLLYIYVTTITFTLISSSNYFALGINCPSKCTCRWEVDGLIVDCSHRGLLKYPPLEEGLPVERLDLSSNLFQEFPNNYAGINTLIHLDLSNNDIQEVAGDALIGYESLRVLDLSNNSIQNWDDINPNVAFQSAENLQKLSLAGNQLERFSSGSDGTPLLMNDMLAELDLSNCGITQVGNVLSGMPSLQKLNLSGNNIKTLTLLLSKSLRALDVSNCSLSVLTSSLSENLPSLEVLNLSWNPGLSLGNNKLGDIFVCETLRQLDVSFCNLDYVDLGGMPNLVVALLKGNTLRSISATMFSNNTELELLDLSRNAIRQIDPIAFTSLRRLIELDLSYNEIFRIDRNQFRNNDALVNINLSRNIFNQFSRFISNSLRTVNLSGCEILDIDPTAFTGFKTLINLDLSNNLISEFPENMRSETLKKLDLSMCRLTIIRNTTFHGFPELASLKLSGNRFTNPFRPEYFRSNTFLSQIWLSDNTWRCDCHDPTFMAFYDFLTIKPQKLKDKSNVKCFSPTAYYLKSWEAACMSVWYPAQNEKAAQKVWVVMVILLIIVGCILMASSCFRNLVRSQMKRRDRREQEENEAELAEIQRINRRLLAQDAQQNAPTGLESMLPTYEDALLMPKLDRGSKSMMDLSSTRKPVSRIRRDIESGRGRIDEEETVLDHHRYRSEELLSNRDKERTAHIGTFRRTGRIEHNPSGSRRFSIEDLRFPAAHLKSQNLQSAERIGNFQSYENSPYSKRRPKPPEISVFKRASIRDSVEFLTDSEYNSKPGSPFAQRRPQIEGATDVSASSTSLSVSSRGLFKGRVPADKSFLTVEEHFARDEVDNKSGSINSSSSDFQVMRSSDVDLASIPSDSNSSSRDEPVVVVHTPIRESKF
ncbi:leucine-rich repeat-containing G-protein coupled receptor 5 [Eupeodes corollae]|uniref:leucine-rich repeat-containing G-protein coupled receptor 5 n=1 Tax=Eupeodes corollae TaxID=290404 RepID=UPI0024908A35|nr:leucine-rich repeat-containing G-protein coupled receptor 5 [Eupeodes corollae]XP_055919687.1 leucine-rich repeat-containing G-protein coupled receptor 5 [Eupeodes corollae]XP_055919688.1 leucine-rich repeat-containing G-protein coupled receptor 5 [Eupeodes corollae]